MPRSLEIAHYSELLASLTVAAARTDDRERLSEIRAALTEAFAGIFTLLSHDAVRGVEQLGDDLLTARAAGVEALR